VTQATDASGSLRWTKSSFSKEGDCVEIAATDDAILVRDSKDKSGPMLHFTPSEWDAFLAGAAAGEFKHL